MIKIVSCRMLIDLQENISGKFCKALNDKFDEITELSNECPYKAKEARIKDKDYADAYVTAAKLVAQAIKEIGEEYGV